MTRYFTIILIALAGCLLLTPEVTGQTQSVLVTPRVQLEAQVVQTQTAQPVQQAQPQVIYQQPQQQQQQQQYSQQTMTPAQYYMQAQMQYYLWFNAHYRPVEGPVRRVIFGPYVRRPVGDPAPFMYHYYMRNR